jgi:triacylglycerol lipase
MTGYYPQMAESLAKICQLTYNQAYRETHEAKYDGAVEPPAGYRQIASFTAPELFFTNNQAPQFLKNLLMQTDLRQIDLTDLADLKKIAIGYKRVFFGFALESTDGSGNGILALRGTRNLFEWLLDASFIQVPVPALWFADGKIAVANAHFGFLLLYAFLVKQITAVAAQFTNLRTCYVTGHSLGGALAVLAALTLGVTVFPLQGKTGKVQLYNYGAPRVGDANFTAVYDYFIPYSYRVVNLSDLVTTIPPQKIFNYQYAHIGGPAQAWSFLHQTGDVGQNHALGTYQAALAAPGVVTNLKRNYPCSGFGGATKLC